MFRQEVPELLKLKKNGQFPDEPVRIKEKLKVSIFCLLLIDETRVKQKTYMSVGVMKD